MNSQLPQSKMTERSELEVIRSPVTPGRKCRSPRKVTFPTEDWNECYNPSAANVSLRKKSSFNPSKLADIEEAKKHQVRLYAESYESRENTDNRLGIQDF